jgi:hypothetical protein
MTKSLLFLILLVVLWNNCQINPQVENTTTITTYNLPDEIQKKPETFSAARSARISISQPIGYYAPNFYNVVLSDGSTYCVFSRKPLDALRRFFIIGHIEHNTTNPRLPEWVFVKDDE